MTKLAALCAGAMAACAAMAGTLGAVYAHQGLLALSAEMGCWAVAQAAMAVGHVHILRKESVDD